MSELRVYPQAGGAPEVSTDHRTIAAVLDGIGVRFARWQADRPLAEDASPDEVIEAYREPIDRLMQENGFQSVDVVSMHPNHPDKQALREKFLSEHTHSEYEVRFFVDGSGLFNIHAGDKVYAVLCEKGDLISVPANTPHWFDMGEHPSFKAIRLFTNPEGWVANYTGDAIADSFPRFGEPA